jgi:hypothetical protein
MENPWGNPFGKCLVGFPYISKSTEYFPCLCHALCEWSSVCRVKVHPSIHYVTNTTWVYSKHCPHMYIYIYTHYIYIHNIYMYTYRLQHIAALFPWLCFDASPSIPNSSIFRAAEWSSAIATSQCPASRHALMPMLMLSSHLSLEVSQSDTKG